MRFGFTNDELSVKLLILYALDKLLPDEKKAATHDELQHLVFLDTNTDYFLFASALRELVETEYLLYERVNEIDMFKITQRARDTVTTMAAKLPASLRDECDKQVGMVINRKLIGEAISATITERSREYIVHLQMNDGMMLMFKLDLMVADRKQAKRILAKYKEKPNRVYQQILQVLDS